MKRLLSGDLSWQRRLELIYDGLQNCRSWRGEKPLNSRSTLIRIFHRESNSTASMCELREVNWVQLHSVLWITEKHHLFPLDLAENIVFYDYDFDRQLIFHCGHKVSH